MTTKEKKLKKCRRRKNKYKFFKRKILRENEPQKPKNLKKMLRRYPA